MRPNLYIIAILSFLVLSTASASAQYSEPEALVNAGLAAYKTGGAEEALKVWIKDSPIDGAKDAMNQVNNLRTVENYYGSYQSAEIIRSREVSKNVRVVYAVFSYSNGPLFARFVVFHTSKTWLLTRFNFNVDDTIAFADLRP